LGFAAGRFVCGLESGNLPNRGRAQSLPSAHRQQCHGHGYHGQGRETAFAEQAKSESTKDEVDRKATIVIEHLIQASDVSHTMQHWHIYRKWNQRLFEEMYVAYKEGRAANDPSDGWHKGELGFFDFYIIPLAKKLKNCGVFGVSSDEYLMYAEKNRQEWSERGHECVSQMVEEVKKKYSTEGGVESTD
jgi:hypothetical protein